MPEFKCISCGEIKESKDICSCPVCGYRMFQTPYDRKDLLISQITGFVLSLQLRAISRDDLIFEHKNTDDARFPDFDRIRRYVSGQERTEAFLNNLYETVEQLKIHLTSGFYKEYPVSYEELDTTIKRLDDALKNAAKILDPEFEFALEPIQWIEATLLYTETQNKYLWFSANELLGLVEKLTKKIGRFIRINNLYGRHHGYCPKKKGDSLSEETDFKDLLEDAIAETEAVLAEKFLIDIDDDGAEALQKMLTSLWHDIEIIMRAPLLLASFEYRVDSSTIREEELFARTAAILEERYADFDRKLCPDGLSGKSEAELFKLYKDLIGIDTFGYLVHVGAELIDIGESEKKLDELIGLSGIKDSIRKIKAYALVNHGSDNLNIHMCFLGNPGSGKTEVARCIAGILYENKVLPTNKVIEVDRSGLVSQFFGATAEKTRRVIASAMGGVLFIDEAYALGNNSEFGLTDYGKEAIDTLVKAMEDHRGEFCVILAGYKNEMLKMLSTNPGFKSRIPFILDFPNYSRDELARIAKLMLKHRQYTMGDAALNRLLDITDIRRKDPNFANAREIRNILDQVIMCQNLRMGGGKDRELGLFDVNKYIQDAKISLPTEVGDASNRVLTGDEELDQLVGLESVKRMVKKIRAYAKRNKGENGFNLHMCFLGNPGTGKTEVARIISRILYDVGVLQEAKLVETDAQGLVGKFVGETAPKTNAKIDEAMNGVLFIDEAYNLIKSADVNSGTASYGEDAIAVLLKRMEDQRGRFCVILAGYKVEMKTMLGSNPGLESRVQFTLEFPDYTREELGEIAVAFLRKKRYEIDEPALQLLLDVTDYDRSRSNFANARTVRSILQQVIMNQNLRTEDTDDDRFIIADDVLDYIADESIDLQKKDDSNRQIGFH